MITWPQFLSLVIDPALLSRRIDRDQAQQDAVAAPQNVSLFIVAGPGSGKTTVLALRVLKLIFVNDLDPGAILATTFTRKAAAELRSRILGWGDQLRRALLVNASNDYLLADRLRGLDFNRVITGTLDGIAEQTLADFRAPGTQPPIPLEEFVADAMMQRSGLWNGRRDQDVSFQNYIRLLRGDGRSPNLRDMLETCREIRDRFLHDQVDIAAFEESESPSNPGVAILCRVIEDYAAKLNADLVIDFAALEQTFLDRLMAGQLDRFTRSLQAILVDEYQDTNLLQERIYFSLAQSVNEQGGSIAVVGDDDQSLYRFRGATVELFADFPQRLLTQCSIQTAPIYLINNYRSTATVTDWCTDYVGLDSAYAPTRVAGKPPLSVARISPYVDYPVLGMFRTDVGTLASDLAAFIDAVFNGNGVTITRGGLQLQVVRKPNGGSIGDCALLCSSPKEYSSGGKARLPLLIRNDLDRLPNRIKVFNPRGQEFSQITEIERLCGLILECADPGAQVQNSIPKFPANIPQVFNRWRAVAQRYIASDPLAPGPVRVNTLRDFVRAWQTRTSQSQRAWPRDVPLIQLVYELITWIPALQDDPEGLVYLEVITRTITQSARFIAYDATIQRDQPQADESVKAVLWGILVPLASGAIDIDEDLIELLPRDRLNILSIHQAKGLEFPLAIVDVGSDFRTKHGKQAFKRFPITGSRSHNLEDILRPYSRLGAPVRSATDRAFDDLMRQYFVAFSRPQDVLLLVGLGPPNGGPNSIPNVATGWTRDGQWPWQGLPSIFYL